MILHEEQFRAIARQRRQEAETAASSYRLRRELAINSRWRLVVGRWLIRVGEWIAPAEPKRRPVPVV